MKDEFIFYILLVVIVCLLVAILVSMALTNKDEVAMFEREEEWDKPHPCTNKDDSMRDMLLHLTLEQAEAIVEYNTYKQAMRGNSYEEVVKARERLLEELTDVKTLCETMMWRLDAGVHERAKIQERVNRKNYERGYFIEKTVL